MYLVLADKADEFTRIKATLGTSVQRVNNRHSLIEELESHKSVKIVVVAPSIKSDIALALAQELRIQYPHVNLILVRARIDMAILAAALESGIKDVIDSQDATSLMNAVRRCETVADQLNERGINQDSSSSRGRVVTVYSAKGGCGKTTLATNLAAALASQKNSRVCLIDLDLQFGDIATALRIQPSKTISNALEMSDSIDIEGLTKVLLRFDDKFDVLLAPTNPSDVELINALFISQIISTLQRHYEFVVIDTSPTLNEVIIQTLQESDLVLLMTTLDMPAIKNLKLTLSALDALGLPKSRRKLVLNKGDLKVGLDQRDVEELIGEEISANIPSNTKVSSATNEGQLIINSHPHNPVSKSIAELGRRVREEFSLNLEARVA